MNMGATFIITLREGFEASLLLGLLYSYLSKTGNRKHFNYVTMGALVAVMACVGLGFAVNLLSGPLLDLGPDLVSAVVLFVAVVLLTWHGWWMQRHAQEMKGNVIRRLDKARSAQRLWVVGVIAFAAVFREGSEMILFLWGLLTQVSSQGGWGNITGGLIGLMTAGALGWMVFRGSDGVSLRMFFAATSILLLFLAAGMFSTGIGRLQGLGILPVTAPLWDTSSILSDEHGVGKLLSGMIGYHARPSVFEAVAYSVYLLIAGLLLFGKSLFVQFTPRPQY